MAIVTKILNANISASRIPENEENHDFYVVKISYYTYHMSHVNHMMSMPVLAYHMSHVNHMMSMPVLAYHMSHVNHMMSLPAQCGCVEDIISRLYMEETGQGLQRTDYHCNRE